MGKYQDSVAEIYEECDYTDDLLALALGLCNGTGKVAAAVLNFNSDFVPKENRARSDLVYELKDCLVYLCAIANKLNIELGI